MPGPLTSADSTRYIGVTLSVSRAFAFRAAVFSNLGEVVNTIDFKMADGELLKLPVGPEPNTRVLKVLWNNRSLRGEKAATGAYVLKASAYIIPDADESGGLSRRLTSRVGVLR